jgi:Peptidase family M50
MSASPSTQSIDQPTPILDRLQPMPSDEKTSWSEWTSQVLIGLATFLLAAVSISSLPRIGQRFADSDISKIGSIAGILFFLVALVMVIMVHELGHFFAGKWAGFRFRYICIGPIQFDHSFKFSYVKDRGDKLGAVCFFPAEMRNHPWKYMLMVIAGPATNIVCAICSCSRLINHSF